MWYPHGCPHFVANITSQSLRVFAKPRDQKARDSRAVGLSLSEDFSIHWRLISATHASQVSFALGVVLYTDAHTACPLFSILHTYTALIAFHRFSHSFFLVHCYM